MNVITLGLLGRFDNTNFNICYKQAFYIQVQTDVDFL